MTKHTAKHTRKRKQTMKKWAIYFKKMTEREPTSREILIYLTAYNMGSRNTLKEMNMKRKNEAERTNTSLKELCNN